MAIVNYATICTDHGNMMLDGKTVIINTCFGLAIFDTVAETVRFRAPGGATYELRGESLARVELNEEDARAIAFAEQWPNG